MGDGLFWLLVFPILAMAVLTFVVILAVGLGTIRAALKSTNTAVKSMLLIAGLLVIASPVVYHWGMEQRAQGNADQRQTYLESLERISLVGILPRRFIAVGNFRPELIAHIRSQYQLMPFPEVQDEQMVEAYRLYRRAELCHRLFGNETVPGTALSKCRSLAVSVQSALNLKEPILVFAEGRHTSLREDNVSAGKMYEIRLITPDQDFLVDYFEERTVNGNPSIFNPYAPERHRASNQRPPTLHEFIEDAMHEASR